MNSFDHIKCFVVMVTQQNTDPAEISNRFNDFFVQVGPELASNIQSTLRGKGTAQSGFF